MDENPQQPKRKDGSGDDDQKAKKGKSASSHTSPSSPRLSEDLSASKPTGEDNEIKKGGKEDADEVEREEGDEGEAQTSVTGSVLTTLRVLRPGTMRLSDGKVKRTTSTIIVYEEEVPEYDPLHLAQWLKEVAGMIPDEPRRVTKAMGKLPPELRQAVTMEMIGTTSWNQFVDVIKVYGDQPPSDDSIHSTITFATGPTESISTGWLRYLQLLDKARLTTSTAEAWTQFVPRIHPAMRRVYEKQLQLRGSHLAVLKAIKERRHNSPLEELNHETVLRS